MRESPRFQVAPWLGHEQARGNVTPGHGILQEARVHDTVVIMTWWVLSSSKFMQHNFLHNNKRSALYTTRGKKNRKGKIHLGVAKGVHELTKMLSLLVWKWSKSDI